MPNCMQLDFSVGLPCMKPIGCGIVLRTTCCQNLALLNGNFCAGIAAKKTVNALVPFRLTNNLGTLELHLEVEEVFDKSASPSFSWLCKRTATHSWPKERQNLLLCILLQLPTSGKFQRNLPTILLAKRRLCQEDSIMLCCFI